MVAILFMAQLLLFSRVDASCTTEITSVSDYLSQKSSYNLIVDVRTFNEYTGNGDSTCNAQKANKCNMGHDSDMWHLVNPDRTDKAVLYKVNGANTVDEKIVKALKDCYGCCAATMKILTSCHSGSRSAKMQQALVDAGFKCENMYNFKPGADGLFKANATLVKSNDQKGPWSCAAAPSSCPECTSGVSCVMPTALVAGLLLLVTFFGL